MDHIHPSPDTKSRSVDARDRFLIVYEHESKTVALEGWPLEGKAREMALFLNGHEGRDRFRVVPRPDYFKTTGV